MRTCLFVLVVSLAPQVFAADSTDITTPDNTKSVLTADQSTAEPAQQTTVKSAQPCSCNCNCNTSGCSCNAPTLSYRAKNKIAPCAVGKNACLSFCEKTTDACCNTTSQRVTVEVPICAPACPTKESVTRSRNGKRAVYDYGRYEAVVRADDAGNVDVRYRKRLLDR
jgi:hypothetical protein